MNVVFTRKTKEDFRKHNDYVRRQKKLDGHNYQKYELDGINKSITNNFRNIMIKMLYKRRVNNILVYFYWCD